MNRNIFIGIALAGIITSAILFLICTGPVSARPAPDTAMSINETIDTVPHVVVRDTVVSLGSTGYYVDMPVDFCMKEIKQDTEFLFLPVIDTSGCDGLRILFTEQPGVVPGKRPINWTDHTILNQQVKFREYTLFETVCRLRTGSLAGDSSNIRITCMWPVGESMERLFGIGLTIHKKGSSAK